MADKTIREIELEEENAHLKMEKDFFDKAKSMFAEKRVEIILYGFIALILVAAAGAWIALIISKPV